MPVPFPQGPTYKKKNYKKHVVKTNDSWNSIANQYGVNASDIASVNQGISLTPGVVVKVPVPKTPTGWGVTINQEQLGIQTPYGNLELPSAASTTPGRGYYRAGEENWISPVLSAANKAAYLLGKNIAKNIINWGEMYRVGMGDVQRAGNYPSQYPQKTAQPGMGDVQRAGYYPSQYGTTQYGTTQYGTTQEITSGNHQENLPYSKSYNYEAAKGTIPTPGLESAIKYFGYEKGMKIMEDATFSGYGYDYGNYLQWAEQKGIKQPANYYTWRSTQGVTRSGQSTQFWEYMQSITSSNRRREKMIDRQKFLAAKRNKPELTWKQWLAWKGGRSFTPKNQTSDSENQAVQPYIGNSGYSGGSYYSSPASFGLITWRT